MFYGPRAFSIAIEDLLWSTEQVPWITEHVLWFIEHALWPYNMFYGHRTYFTGHRTCSMVTILIRARKQIITFFLCTL